MASRRPFDSAQDRLRAARHPSTEPVLSSAEGLRSAQGERVLAGALAQDLARVLLVLHAHLPWVVDTSQEHWLHEAILDCYLPLLDVLEKLPDGAHRLTLSVSPVLCAMLKHPAARRRTDAYL